MPVIDVILAEAFAPKNTGFVSPAAIVVAVPTPFASNPPFFAGETADQSPAAVHPVADVPMPVITTPPRTPA
ncbi:hypothetical protein [Curtobacterium sp. PhB115]|uniref:hypothetical protein n=1 Tax=Curtobacterium sp. PhB115 TaxID=2485173 RepID=UPI001617A225|nr:hypothetical protein [Curtobacterium sp. PhB115]